MQRAFDDQKIIPIRQNNQSNFQDPFSDDAIFVLKIKKFFRGTVGPLTYRTGRKINGLIEADIFFEIECCLVAQIPFFSTAPCHDRQHTLQMFQSYQYHAISIQFQSIHLIIFKHQIYQPLT